MAPIAYNDCIYAPGVYIFYLGLVGGAYTCPFWSGMCTFLLFVMFHKLFLKTVSIQWVFMSIGVYPCPNQGLSYTFLIFI